MFFIFNRKKGAKAIPDKSATPLLSGAGFWQFNI
jgi:hypothetical protein